MPSPPTVVALYLPQYHPVPENDEWWGKGFTEWTNVTKARPLFKGHEQPNLPADLGFYDLRLPEARAAQAALARAYGVGAFCYYHYWFGNGRRLLEQPFNEVLASGQPDLPFMLCWANQTWAGVWHGSAGRTLIEQLYPGRADHERHFREALLPAFLDPRYLRVNGKPVFMVYRAQDLPDCRQTLQLWRDMAQAAGLPGLYLLADHGDPFWDAAALGFDAFVNARPIQRRRDWVPWTQPLAKLRGRALDWLGRPTIEDYASRVDYFVPEHASPSAIPCVLPNWDNTPRSGARGFVLQGSTPALFGLQLKRALQRVRQRRSEDQLLFVKSWNEWAEGNHLEPGRRFGHSYLETLRDAVTG